MRDLAAFLNLAALVLGPVAAVAWPAVRAPLERRTAWRLAGASVAIVAVACTPVSLAGTLADPPALAAAYVAFCFATLGVWRRPLVRMLAGAVFLATVLVPGLYMIVFGAPPRVTGLERLPCGQALRTEALDYHALYGARVSVVWQPPYVPVEVRLARQSFIHEAGAPWYTGEHHFRAVPRGRSRAAGAAWTWRTGRASCGGHGRGTVRASARVCGR